MRKKVPLDAINPFDEGHSEKMDGVHREGTDKVKELIRQNKRILPILVKPVEGKPYKYQRLDGYKRYFAYKELGYREIECIIDPAGIAGGQDGLPWIEPKKAVVTLSIGRSQKWAEYSCPSFRAYAQKIGADFIVIDKRKVPDRSVCYEKFQIKGFLEEGYERIMYIDSDAFIKPSCPNLFDLKAPEGVPYEQIGGVYDTKENKPGNKDRIKEVKKALGDIEWEEGYINDGVFLVSNMHKEIFNIPENAPNTWMWNMHVLNYNIYKLGFPIFKLDTKYNAMHLYGYPTDKEPQDINAYIVHYAACGEKWKRLKFLYEKYKGEF